MLLPAATLRRQPLSRADDETRSRSQHDRHTPPGEQLPRELSVRDEVITGVIRVANYSAKGSWNRGQRTSAVAQRNPRRHDLAQECSGDGGVGVGPMCRLFGLHAGAEPVSATFWLLDAPDS